MAGFSCQTASIPILFLLSSFAAKSQMRSPPGTPQKPERIQAAAIAAIIQNTSAAASALPVLIGVHSVLISAHNPIFVKKAAVRLLS